jgi:hypothetical protein
MVETNELYFQPRYGSLPEDIFEHTYQALYILRSLGEPDANHEKVTTYLQNHLDYENLKNVYFTYKIKELYDLNIEFDISATQYLIQTTYNADNNNFYINLNLQIIEPRAFGWVVEMAKNDEVSLAIQMNDTVPLGGIQEITVSVGNLVLSQLGNYATVKFHSSLLGTQIFTVQPDGSRHVDIPIPIEPSYYPIVEGNITVYDGLVEIKRKSINFQTTYNLLSSYSWKNESGVIIVSLNASQVCGTTKTPLSYGTAFGKIFKEGSYLRTAIMARDDMANHSEFSLSYVPLNHGNYTIDLYLNDGYNQTDKAVGKIFIGVSTPANVNPNPDPLKKDEISMSVGLIVSFITLPGLTFLLSKRYINNRKVDF